MTAWHLQDVKIIPLIGAFAELVATLADEVNDR